MKTVIEMAREAAAVHGHTFKAVPSPETIEFITAFAELVRADERERIYFQTSSDFVKAAIAEEREVCAKVCETEWSNVAERMYGEECAAAIRARSNT